MRTHRAQIVFYGGALAMLSLIIFRGVDAMLPTHLATLIAQNSEALAYAPLVALAVDVLRHRRLPVIAAVVALELAAGVALAASIGHIDSRIATVNEGVLAAAVVTAYVSLRRPLRWAGAAAAALLLVTILANRTAVITQQAETLAFITLAPLAFDLGDRRSLDPGAPDRPGLRRLTWAALLIIPVLISVLRDRAYEGLLGEVIRYSSRLTEAFLGTLMVLVYLWWRRRTPGAEPRLPRALG